MHLVKRSDNCLGKTIHNDVAHVRQEAASGEEGAVWVQDGLLSWHHTGKAGALVAGPQFRRYLRQVAAPLLTLSVRARAATCLAISLPPSARKATVG